MPTHLSSLCKIKGDRPGLNRRHDEIIATALSALAQKMNCVVVKTWKAKGKTASQMKYLGAIFKGIDQ